MTENTTELLPFEVPAKEIDGETGEVMQVSPGEIVVSDNPEYTIVKLPNGEFKKKMKYKTYYSRTAETPEEKIELYKVFNDQESDIVTPLKNMVKKEISIKHVFIQPYESFDEKTGDTKNGATTTIQDIEGNYYATSSLSVYYTILNIMDTFGYPSNEGYAPVKVMVTGTKRQHGVQINLELIGLA